MQKNSEIQKILIVGNAAGGKTRLARRFSDLYGLPVTHVDSIQFLPGMVIRPLHESRKALAAVTAEPQWIIDGHGPLDQIEQRFLIADRIVFVDLPIATHFWWVFKRQLKSFWSRRPELAEGCNEATFKHSLKLVSTMWKMHKQMRPQLLRIFAKENLKNKVLTIRTRAQWKSAYEEGIDPVLENPKS